MAEVFASDFMPKSCRENQIWFSRNTRQSSLYMDVSGIGILVANTQLRQAVVSIFGQTSFPKMLHGTLTKLLHWSDLAGAFLLYGNVSCVKG